MKKKTARKKWKEVSLTFSSNDLCPVRGLRTRGELKPKRYGGIRKHILT